MKKIEEMTPEQLKQQLAVSDRVIERLQNQLGKNEGLIARLETVNEGLRKANKELSESLSKIKQLDKENKKNAG
jgi:cell shape-determining protein MreC